MREETESGKKGRLQSIVGPFVAICLALATIPRVSQAQALLSCPHSSYSIGKAIPLADAFEHPRAKGSESNPSSNSPDKNDQDFENPRKHEPYMQDDPQKPPPRIGTEMLGGLVGGVIGAGVGAVVFSGFTEDDAGWIDVRAMAAWAGAIIMYPLGSAIGVYAVGANETETGSFPMTLVASYGFGLGLGLSSLAVGAVNDDPGIAGVILIVGAPVGATLGFNGTRRYRSPPSENGFINIEDGHVRVGLPDLGFRSDRYDDGVLVQSVNVLRVTF